MNWKFTFTLCTFFVSLFAAAQEKIETDRPDQTETPFTVPKKYFQAEFGFNKENFKDGSYELVHPTGLLKYGLSKKLELRLEGNVKTAFAEDPATEKTTRLEPIEIGTKLALWEEKGILPKTSVITHVGLPFLASKEARPDLLPFSIRLSLQNSLTEKIALGYNFGIERDGWEDKTSWFYTLAPGLEIGEKWYAYAEIFGSVAKGEEPEHALDGGLAYFVNKDVKIDISAGFSLYSESLKNYVAIGFSFRIPLKK